jgi:hypothetical protein
MCSSCHLARGSNWRCPSRAQAWLSALALADLVGVAAVAHAGALATANPMESALEGMSDVQGRWERSPSLEQ